MSRRRHLWLTCSALLGCASGSNTLVGMDAALTDGTIAFRDAATERTPTLDAIVADDALPDAPEAPEASAPDAPREAGPALTPLAANRDRLLATYLAWLQSHPDATQSNGLRGSELSSTCALWQRLDPSSRATYLTLTARLQGSRLGADGSAALDHLTALYRVAGGQGASATSAGSCGGGEYNRMLASMDAQLQSAFLAANAHRGARTSAGYFDVADVPAGGSWRDSHDLGGPHAPFDLSDETNDGAPRGQVQYFRDPASAAARAPLGRLDLATLVDPYALEMDQDYDCVHSSNPLCDYVFYGTGCLPQAQRQGTELFAANYGGLEPGWQPRGCP